MFGWLKTLLYGLGRNKGERQAQKTTINNAGDWHKLRSDAEELIFSMVNLSSVEQIREAYTELELIYQQMNSGRTKKVEVPKIDFDSLELIRDDWSAVRQIQGVFTKRNLRELLKDSGYSRWESAPDILYSAVQQGLVEKVTNQKYKVVSKNEFSVGSELNNDVLFVPFLSRAIGNRG